MPTDALIALQASVTKTATFNGAALILAGGTPRRGLWARIVYSAANTSSGAGTLSWSIDACYDGVPTTWFSDFISPTLTLSATAQAGEIYIPFNVQPTVVSGAITAPQIRLSVFAITGTGATVTYQGDIVLTKP